MKSTQTQYAVSLYSRDGQRKYLTSQERTRFIAAAERCPRPNIGTLCLVLAYTGCRLSEALAITGNAINAEDNSIAIQSLKKRGAFIIREIPVPQTLIARLNAQKGQPTQRLWPLSRGHAWLLIKSVMKEAGIAAGARQTPKGLRHGFGVHALRSGVPITLVQRWLGHASLATTAIYTQVLGREEWEIASRMW